MSFINTVSDFLLTYFTNYYQTFNEYSAIYESRKSEMKTKFREFISGIILLIISYYLIQWFIYLFKLYDNL